MVQANQDGIAEVKAWMENHRKAAMMAIAACNTRYGTMKDYLDNRYTIHQANEYPINTTRLLSQMDTFRPERARARTKRSPSIVNPEGDAPGVNFAQKSKEVEKTEERTRPCSMVETFYIYRAGGSVIVSPNPRGTVTLPPSPSRNHTLRQPSTLGSLPWHPTRPSIVR